ncbi:MAG: GNAT family N-acetyltransferase [Micropepsaceae bacterium]
MTGLVIRPALPHDHDGWLDAALAAWLDAYQLVLPAEEVANAPAMLDAAWNKRSGELRVAILHGEVAGFYSLGDAARPGEANYLWHLYVDPRFQRRGIGRALHDAALAEIASRGAANAWLDVIRQNDKARAFYAALGWRITKADTSDGYDLLIMERDI